nr:hypothetical protein [Tanacetum cinerariifolium]
MDLFNLIHAPNPTKVNTESRPRAPHEVPLLTLTATWVIDMDEPVVATDSSGVPSTIKRSLVDLAHEAEASDRGTAAPEMPPPEDVPATAIMGLMLTPPPKSLRTDHADLRPSGAPADVNDPDPLYFADAPSRHPVDVVQSSQGIAAAGDPESKNVSSPAKVGSSRSYNVNLARQVAMGLQLRLRFEQEVKLLRKSVAQVARRDKRIQARELEIKNLEELLEAEADMKKAIEAIVGRRWVIGHELRLAMMKCAESLEMKQAFADVVSAGVAKALPSLKDLKYPLLDQLEGLKDAHMDVIMAALYLESDTREDAPQSIRDLHPSSSQLTIPCIWRSDGIPVSVPMVVP